MLTTDLETLDDELNREVKSMSKVNMREAERVENMAKAATKTFKAQRAKNEGDSEKAIDQLRTTAQKEIDGITQSSRGAVQALEDVNDENADEYDGYRKESVRDLNREISGLEKDDAASELELTTAEIDTNTAMQLANDESATLEEDADEMNDEATDTLNAQVDKTESKIMQTRGSLEGAMAESNQEIEGGMDDIKDSVLSGAYEAKATVESGVQTEVTALHNKVTVETMDMRTGINDLQNDADGVAKELSASSQVLAGMKHQMGENKASLAERATEVAASINETATNGDEVLQESRDGVADSEAGATTMLNKEVDRASLEENDLSASIQRSLIGKISALQAQAGDEMGRSEKTIQSASERGSDVLASMNIAVGNIEKLKEGIEQTLPAAQKTVAEQLTSMQGEILNAATHLSNTKTSAMAIANELKAGMTVDSATKIGDTRAGINKKLKESADRMGSEIESLAGTTENLKSGSENDYTAGVNFADSKRREIEKALKQIGDASAAAQANDVEIGERLRMAKNAAAAGINAQNREGGVMQKAAVAAFEQKLLNQKSVSGQEIDAALAAAKAEVLDFSQKADKSLSEDMTKTKANMQENNAAYGEKKFKIDDLAERLGLSEQVAKGKEMAAEHKFESLEKYEKSIENKASSAEASESALFAQQKAELRQLQDKSISEMTEQEKTRLEEILQATNQKFGEDATRQTLLTAKSKGQITEMDEGLGQRVAGIENAVKRTRLDKQQLESGEVEMAKNLNNEAGAVSAAMTIGEDAVKRGEEAEEKEMGGTMDGDLTLMEGLLGLFGNTKGLAGAELENLDEEFSKELEGYKLAGESTSRSLTENIMRLVNNAPDFLAMFAADTGTAGKEMVEQHGRLDKAKDWTNDVMNQYGTQLEELRGKRETRAEEIHGKASQLKRLAQDQASKTLDTVSKLRDTLGSTKGNLNDQLSAFKNKLKQLSGVTVDHNQEEVDAMDERYFNLQANHGRLMDWKDHFRHHTVAWRDEVENNLRKTGHDVSFGAADEQTNRLGSEVNMNQALRAMQLRTEEVLAENDADSTRQFENLAGAMGAGVQNVLAGEMAARAKSTHAEEQAEDAMKRDESAQGTAIDGVKDNQRAIGSGAAELAKQTMLAGQELTTMLQLPKLTVSKQNRETDEEYSSVNANLAKLAAQQSSLLEEKASIAEKKLRDAPDTPESESAEEKAIDDLNKELSAENDKLSKQNNKLGVGLERKEEKLKALKKKVQ